MRVPRDLGRRPRPLRALVVIGDDTAAERSRSILEREAGMSVVVAADGAHAIALLADSPFDLVVTGIELADGSGLAMLDRAAEVAPGIPVIVLTSHPRVEYAVEALRHHVEDFLVQPVEPRVLAERAVALAREGRARREGAVAASVLAVGAHPDDVEIGVGGTLAAHHAAGDAVTILTLSGGAVGGLPQARHEEALAAAAVIGARLVHLDFRDTEVGPVNRVIDAVEAVVADVRPDRVYTHSTNDQHQDHQTVARAVHVAARGVPSLAAFQSPSATVAFRPTEFIDIEAYLETKLRMLRAFRSQRSHPYMAEDLVRATARYWSRFGGGRYVEPLELVFSDVRLVPVRGVPLGQAAARAAGTNGAGHAPGDTVGEADGERTGEPAAAASEDDVAPSTV